MNERWLQLLQSEGASFTNGRVAHFVDAPVLGGGAALCDLSHYGVIKVSGEDAAKFLQAQFTNDVAALNVGQAQWNGWCSPKGRLLVTFLIWRTESHYVLLLQKSLQAAIQKRLGMFVLRSKVVIEDASDTWQRMGVVIGVDAAATTTNSTYRLPSVLMQSETGSLGFTIRLSAQRMLILAETDMAMATWQTLAKTLSRAGSNDWDLASIRDGIIDISPETQDAYVPQMVNYELIGAVNFKKGCYPGQEIVARTHHIAPATGAGAAAGSVAW
ncbi:MAG: folate-binding protein YgfZ [Gammaproteobacteria bacterium]|nr:folate-binding protein YgfZ [Gammaproteobacteria bacterium]